MQLSSDEHVSSGFQDSSRVQFSSPYNAQTFINIDCNKFSVRESFNILVYSSIFDTYNMYFFFLHHYQYFVKMVYCVNHSPSPMPLYVKNSYLLRISECDLIWT